MESSLSVDQMMARQADDENTTLEENIFFDALDAPSLAQGETDDNIVDRQTAPLVKTTVDLEEQIRCVTIDCVEKTVSKRMEQMYEHLDRLETSVDKKFRRNTHRLKNMWRHHTQAVGRLDELVEVEPEKPSELEKENEKLRIELNHLRGVLRVSSDKIDELSERVEENVVRTVEDVEVDTDSE